jgi:ribosomal protein S9
MSAAVQSVQCFGKKKTATAVAHCKQGKGLIKVNGKPLSLVEPQVLRFKVYEPILLLGLDKFGTYLCVTGGVEDGERVIRGAGMGTRYAILRLEGYTTI